MSEVKFFNKWEVKDIKVEDPGLEAYIVLHPQVVPVTGGRLAKFRFYKSKASLVERLANKIMIPGHRAKKHKLSSGHMCGQKVQALDIVKRAFEIVEEKTKKNPIAVLVKAVEIAAPREEITAIEYGGARYPKAVECSPQRRIDLVLRFMAQGAYQKSFSKKRAVYESLADEIINASLSKGESNAIAKKNELERQADASR
jgi:small subunit ribosomal protein S7